MKFQATIRYWRPERGPSRCLTSAGHVLNARPIGEGEHAAEAGERETARETAVVAEGGG